MSNASANHLPFTTAFVTGATGLLGNNLVRALVDRGVKVKALVRSVDKARQQFADLPTVAIVRGDMADIGGFAHELRGCDVLFHTAAYFRDGYKGGSHASAFEDTNVLGTRKLLVAAYDAGIRRMVHTSSIAVLDGPRGALIDESMLRNINNADDYYRSKILSDHEVLQFLDAKPDFFAAMVLPGWMHGPGDIGPTSAGQTVTEFLLGKLPGVPPGTVSVVDARDVARIQIEAAARGRRAERYLAAGQHMTMTEVFAALEKVSGVAAPKKKIPIALLWVLAAFSEAAAKLTGKAALMSWATVRLMAQESERTRFDPSKTERELGITFRPVEDTFATEIAWYQKNGWLEGVSLPRLTSLQPA